MCVDVHNSLFAAMKVQPGSSAIAWQFIAEVGELTTEKALPLPER